MKTILLAIATLFISQKFIGQDYMDLLALIADEKYEKCLFKCEKLMGNDDTKNDPIPYLYTAMSYYEISQDHKYKDDYPKAFASALSYLGKYRKKDKAYEFKEDAVEFIEKVKFILLEEVENNALEGTEKSAKSSASTMKKVLAFDPDDHGAELIQGMNYTISKNKTEGRTVTADALEAIKKISTDKQFGSMTESQQKYLKISLIQYAKYLLPSDPQGAKEVINLGHEFFYEKRDDCHLDNIADFKSLYDKING